MKTNLVVVNQAALNQLLMLTRHLAETSNNQNAKQDLFNLEQNIGVVPNELESQAGDMIVDTLSLKEYKDLYPTKFGGRTKLGIYRTLTDALQEIEVEYEPIALTVNPNGTQICTQHDFWTPLPKELGFNPQ